jgi:hypothetical protein
MGKNSLVQILEQARRHGNRAKNAPPSLLQRFEDERSGVQVHAVDGERQGLGDATAGEGEDGAQGAHGARVVVCGAQEAGPLVGGQVFAFAVLKQGSRENSDDRAR